VNTHRFVVACRRLTIALAGVLALAGALLPSAASAATRAVDPLGGFEIQVPAGGLIVHENAGSAVVTVTRPLPESAFAAQIRYVTSGDGYNPDTQAPYDCGGTPCTATSYDFKSVRGELDFGVGETSKTFSVPISDHGTTSVPKTLQVSLFAPSSGPLTPIGLGAGYLTTLTILNDDPVAAPVAGNPLGLPTRPGSNPLTGASFFVDPLSTVANLAKSNPALNVIAGQPGTARFGTFSYGSPYVPDIGTAVSRYLVRAAATSPGTVPLLATYRLVHGVHGNGDSTAEQQSYHNFITGFAQGIGSYPAVLFLEEDSLITTPGLNRTGVAVRMSELSDAINVLSANCPHLVVYLDAGAADALPYRTAASLLNRAGVAKIEGFFLNSTHFDRTSKEIAYGNKISGMTGGKHFVINTGENGQGALVPQNIVKYGNEILCNPKGRGLGPKPTAQTGARNVDMFAWTSNPGESGGACRPNLKQYEVQGAPSTGAYWPAYAQMLVKNANFRVT
jgi:endoglucanase